MEWLYNDRPVTDDDTNGHVAFVYRITNLQTGRQYLGKKRLTFFRRKKVADKKRRKKVVSESDWRSYTGSNEALNVDIANLGEENFRKEILCFCQTLGHASYLELKYQITESVLEQPDKYYNSIIQCRIHRKHVASLPQVS